ncbi:MAG TPA: tripartite tricarboxylate transporter TctB family protein [Burkholderiales bacterium]|nr:tripartite tricarboxylate transporter TctB family protein [Burkholderiales bacterium]
MRSAFARALPYAVVGAIAAWLFFEATRIEFQRRAGTIGPDAWPKLVLALLLVVCVYEIVRLFASSRYRGGAAGVLQELIRQSAPAQGEAAQVAPPARLLLLAAGVGLTALYVWVIQRLGFVLATAPYLFAFIALGGYRRWVVNAAVSGIGTIVMMFFFMKVVYVSLPIGAEPFAQVTIALMRLMGIR